MSNTVLIDTLKVIAWQCSSKSNQEISDIAWNGLVKYGEQDNEVLIRFIAKVAKEQDGTLLGNEASQVLAGMGELR